MIINVISVIITQKRKMKQLQTQEKMKQCVKATGVSFFHMVGKSELINLIHFTSEFGKGFFGEGGLIIRATMR